MKKETKATTSNQIIPGMTLSISDKLYLVESSVKVTVAQGNPFVKTKLKSLATGKVIEKNFKLGQPINDVSLIEKQIEFLYPEGKEYLFLDLETLDNILIPVDIVEKKVDFLKEGVQVKAAFYGDTIFSIELPQFLELMVVKIEDAVISKSSGAGGKEAYLETGAKIVVPPFVDTGDIIKIDTKEREFIQRV